MKDNENNDIYAIVNLEGYAREMRDCAAKSLCDNFDDNLDEYISIAQMINLIKDQCVGFDDNSRPLLNEDTNEKIYESTVSWIHNVGLAKLASKGLIECAWDNKENSMIFWANEKTTNYRDTSKMVDKTGESNDKSIKRGNKKKNKGS